MKTLVTGATGFIGFWVAKKLLEKNYEIKVLVRNFIPPHLKVLEKDIEMCKGDLRDKDSLKKALEGCNKLYHVAAYYKLWDSQPSVFYKINVEGTKNLLEIALKKSLEKVVYTSSIATIKLYKDRPSNENDIATLNDMVGHYKRSKFLAEEEVKKFVNQGLPVVIVNPSAPIGEYDVKPTPTGQIILDFLKRKIPAYMDTGLNLVDVEDVAIGHILAEEKGRIGERYILGNENLKLKEIFDILEEITGIKSPKIRLPYGIAYTIAVFNEIFSKVTNIPPRVPLDGVKMAKKYMFFDISKAKKELNFNPKPVKKALEKAVNWFKENNYV